jgi:hypothetical protein
LSGKVSAFDLDGQGLYLQFCMAAWIAQGPFNVCSTHVELRFKRPASWVSDTVNAMLDLGILLKDGEKYRIKFIDDQLAGMFDQREKHSKAGKESARQRALAQEDQEKKGVKEEVTKQEKSSALPSVQRALNGCSTPVETKPRNKAVPDSVETAKEYAESIGLAGTEAEAFFDHFTANGWKQGGKAAMKDWRASMRNWKRNQGRFGQKAPSPVTLTNFNRETNRKPVKLSIQSYADIQNPANDVVELACLVTGESTDAGRGFWRKAEAVIGNPVFRSLLSTLWGEMKSGERPANPAAVLSAKLKTAMEAR